MSKQGFIAEHFDDENGNPAGGTAQGEGLMISWQNGPLGRGDDRQAPNGAFVEDVIDIVIDRLEYYQNSAFACEENADALVALREAGKRLHERTEEREARTVEGTHTV